MKLLALAFIAVLFSSCASLTDKARNLRIAQSPSDVASCTPAGRVQAGSSFGGDGGATLIGNRNSKIKLYNMAAEYGDTILMVQDRAHLFGSEREALVYKCLNVSKSE